MLTADLRPAITAGPDSAGGRLFTWPHLHSAVQFTRPGVEGLFLLAQTMSTMLDRGHQGGELERSSLALVTCDQGNPTSDSFLAAARWLDCRQISVHTPRPTTREGLKNLAGRLPEVDILVVSHLEPESSQIISSNLEGRNVRVISGWSGRENPTAALAALLTVRQKLSRIEPLKLTIIGAGAGPEAASLALLLSAVTTKPEITIVCPAKEGLLFDCAQALTRSGVILRETEDLVNAIGWSDVTCLAGPNYPSDYLHEVLGAGHPFFLDLTPHLNRDPDPQTVA